MEHIIQRIYEHEKKRRIYLHSYLEAFFSEDRPQETHPDIREKQNFLLSTLIETPYHDAYFMEFIFSTIAEFDFERRRSFIALFLKHNNTFEDFRKLRLEPSSKTWSGSAVPMFQAEMEYLESILPLLNSVSYLKHKQYLERIFRKSEIKLRNIRNMILCMIRHHLTEMK